MSLLPGVLAAASLLAQAQPPGETGLDAIATPASIEGLRMARDSLVEVADFSGALGPAERIVAALESNEAAAGLGQDVLSLAAVQAALNDLDAAERSYLRALDLLDREGDDSPSSLIAINQALGRIYIDTRRFPEAISVLEEARTLSRQNEGLYNVGQSGIIDDLTRAYLGTGDTLQARELQLQRLENAQRRFGPEDERLIPFLLNLGDYLERSRLQVSAREQYARALQISANNFGADDPVNLALLRKLVAIDLVLGDRGTARDRLADILRARRDIDPVERSLSLAMLGDWALVNATPAAAHMYYRDAHAAFAHSNAVVAAEVFSEVRMVDFVPPLSPVDRGARRELWTWGTLVLEFDVGTDGRAQDVAVVSMEPNQDSIAAAYVRRIRETHFRPQLRDGVAVHTAAVRYEQSFRYYVDDGGRRRRRAATTEGADD